MKIKDLPNWCARHYELVFYCPILDLMFIYTLAFWKDHREQFKNNGLVLIGKL
jgi:hypothetical protein